MGATINTLSDATLRLLYDQFRRLRAQVWNIEQSLPAVTAQRSPPGCYLALTDSSGIPERTELAGVQTPGSGVVTLYNISDTEKLAYTELSVAAFNIGEDAIPPDVFILISRDWLSGKYIATYIPPEDIATEVEGTLDDDLTTSDGTVNITVDFYGNGTNPGETLEVNNPVSGINSPDKIFAAPSGARCRATRFGDVWRITWVECSE